MYIRSDPPIRFSMELRGQTVAIEAQMRYGRNSFLPVITLTDDQGAPVQWDLTRSELAAVCREAARVGGENATPQG